MLIGIVGKPSTGKSSFFMAATAVAVERSPRPFTTIKPNHAVGYVEVECVDKEFGVQCNPRTGYCVRGKRFVPVELLDVAGLVPGAHEGKGLGNKFLDDLRQADALIHIVDASGSTNETGERVEIGTYDPANDIRFLEDELDFWIKGIMDNNWAKLAKEARMKGNEEALFGQFTGLKISRDAIARTLTELALKEKPLESWSEEDKMGFAKRMRAIGKPILIAANKCDLPGAYKNYERLVKEFPQYIIVPCSAEAEIALKSAAKNNYIKYVPGEDDFEIIGGVDEQQKKALEFLRVYIKSAKGTGVQKALNAAVFELLRYVAVFPGGVNKLADNDGNVLPDVFLFPPGSTALDFAARIHKDMAKNFIRAINAKTKRALGADYVLQHRDVLEIVFGR
ncbi:MAG: redox-regulated ATPase YchF [Candidatus Micrarchaeota archaeon]|nr:redox-regulated ATPase YchF [Candidatus Micrarchaeota archaeon]